jgi:hypothetical protein
VIDIQIFIPQVVVEDCGVIVNLRDVTGELKLMCLMYRLNVFYSLLLERMMDVTIEKGMTVSYTFSNYVMVIVLVI